MSLIVTQKFHTPVMLNAVLDFLNLKPSKIVVDATIGTGGHSIAILEKILPGGRLIGIDRDPESLAVCEQRLSNFDTNFELIHDNFMNIDKILKGSGIDKVDGMLFDLGVSSYQLENPDRGFSFQYEGPLDMRLDRNSYISAYDLINNLNEHEISTLLWNFGHERWHNRIAHLLVTEREKHPISTTAELAEIVVKAIPLRFRYRYHHIHPATRTFQAVRIAVNRELENLQIAINKAIYLLNKDARICIISFHSLEDRIVKHTFRNIALQGLIKIITPKPVIPNAAELESNLSSRSGKLRVAQRVL